jgi:hypothetical protein
MNSVYWCQHFKSIVLTSCFDQVLGAVSLLAEEISSPLASKSVGQPHFCCWPCPNMIFTHFICSNSSLVLLTGFTFWPSLLISCLELSYKTQILTPKVLESLKLIARTSGAMLGSIHQPGPFCEGLWCQLPFWLFFLCQEFEPSLVRGLVLVNHFYWLGSDPTCVFIF